MAIIRRPGFTLIELLIVVVILGILATIAIAKVRPVSDRAYLATMKTDLRTLSIEEESVNQRTMHYGDLADLDDFRTTSGVTVQLTHLEPRAYAATAVHRALPGITCGVFRGTVPEGSAGPATVEGRITCQ